MPWYSWLSELIIRSVKPANLHDVIQLLRQANAKNIVDDEALSIIEGVLQISELRVGDFMVPRTKIIAIEKQQPLEDFLPIIIESQHSRFPIYDQELDTINGILLAKDLLTYLLDKQQTCDLRELLRPAIFIPKNKRLNILLREFRHSKNLMAIVVDEYGHVAGLITIEDVLEQIVGNIEDEHDVEDEDMIKKHDDHTYIIKAMLPIDEFNHYFSATLDDENCDTIGGLLMKRFSHIPRRNESIAIGIYTFTILHADARRIRLVRVMT